MKARRLEYSFILHTCRLSDRVRKGTNPFTGEAVEFPIDDGLTEAERDAVRGVFAKHGVQGPEPEFEGYALYLPANCSVRFRGGGLDFDEPPPTSFAVEIVVQELSDEVLNVVLEVARQGNLAFMSSIGDHVRLVEKSSEPRIKKRWPNTLLMQTTDALRSWLETYIGG